MCRTRPSRESLDGGTARSASRVASSLGALAQQGGPVPVEPVAEQVRLGLVAAVRVVLRTLDIGCGPIRRQPMHRLSRTRANSSRPSTRSAWHDQDDEHRHYGMVLAGVECAVGAGSNKGVVGAGTARGGIRPLGDRARGTGPVDHRRRRLRRLRVPAAPSGQIRDALVGHQLVAAHRRGKSMWCDTDGGPALGVHLGMSGKIVVADPDGSEIDGGDYWEGRRAPGDYRWSRFSLTFQDGGRLMLVDPRRFGRIVLDPALDELGPDAATISAGEFKAAIAKGTRASRPDCSTRARSPGSATCSRTKSCGGPASIPRVRSTSSTVPTSSDSCVPLGGAVSAALKRGGAHALDVIPYRKAGARCPRDDAPMVHGKAGGRTSWWCDAEQQLSGSSRT